MSFEEFKALNNIYPSTLKEVKWICTTIEQFERDHPELREQIEAYYNKELVEIVEELTKNHAEGIFSSRNWV